MKRILGPAILALMLSATVMTAQNAQTFYLVTAARAGNVKLPHGICEVTWSTPSGSRVRLNIKTEDQKTVTRTHDPEDAPRFTSRYWDINSKPLYPFGYGVSYSTFKFANLQLSKTSMRVGTQPR
jgi:hypothetical protein